MRLGFSISRETLSGFTCRTRIVILSQSANCFNVWNLLHVGLQNMLLVIPSLSFWLLSKLNY